MRLATGVLLLLVACKDDATSNPVKDSATPTPSSSPSSVSSARSIDAAAFIVPAVTTPCRLIVVTGDATLPDAGVLRSLQAAPPDFIALSAGSSLTAKDTKTGREVTMKGEGRIRACVGGREEEWLERGEFASVPGAGESPGAEVWVMTVHGVIRYALGHVHVTVKDKTTRIRGSASVFPAPSATLRGIDAGVPSVGADGWAELAQGELEIESAPKAQELIDACSKQAADAQKLAKQMLAGDAGNLGDLGSQHVVLRQRARAVCGMAHLAASSSADQAKIEAAETMWRDVPTR